MPPKKAKPAAAKKAPPMSQRALEELGMLPPLKDPRAAVGKELELLGSFWGDSCPARDRSKTFKCSIADFTLLHKPASGTPGPHFEVVVLGAGSERPSEPFFVQYPMPFLKHYYETFPGEKVVNKQTDHGAAAARDTAEADGGEEAEAAQAPHSSTSVYDHLTFVKSRKEGSRTISSFKCAINGCGSPVTIYGKSTGVFFKHCRRAAKQDTAHARVLEELNELSCRQVRLPSLALCITTLASTATAATLATALAALHVPVHVLGTRTRIVLVLVFVLNELLCAGRCVFPLASLSLS